MDNRYETEIDLKDMLFYVLYKWRSILAGALVVGVLAGGCKFLVNALENTGEYGKTNESRKYEIKLAEYELAVADNERTQEYYQVQLEQQQAYMEKSVLMQISPFYVPTAMMDVFVKVDKTEWDNLPANTSLDPTDSLINAYTSNFHSTIDWTPIEELTGKELIYLRELLDVSTDYNGNTFTVSIRYSDGNTALEILDIIAEQIIAKYQEMDMEVNKHTISIINRSLAYSIDVSLADAQKQGKDTISYYEQAILGCQTERMELALPLPPNSIRKFFVIGLASGCFLIFLFHAGMYMLGNRLHGERLLKDKYGYALLGIVPKSRGKNSRLSFIDHILNKLEGTRRQAGIEEACHIIAANIRNLAGENKRLLMIGTVNTQKLQEFARTISPELEDYILLEGGDMNRDAKTLTALAECNAIILVEERDKSLIADIQIEQEGIAELNKKVIGYVLL